MVVRAKRVTNYFENRHLRVTNLAKLLIINNIFVTPRVTPFYLVYSRLSLVF